jgi:N-hydroxyarylamine O-acetyltransferase
MAQQHPAMVAVEAMALSDELMALYCERVGLVWSPEARLQPTVELLFEVHTKQFLGIPFENLSVLLGSGVDVSVEGFLRKVGGKTSRRGGYCFEQNRLLAAVLLKLGFQVEMKQARVWLDDGETLRKPYLPLHSHACLIVRPDDVDRLYLCDVGFGRMFPVEPVPLVRDKPVENGWCQTELCCQMEETAFFAQEMWTLWFLNPITDAWVRAYSFDINARCDWVDAVPLNMFVQSHPESIFTQLLWVEAARADNSHLLLFGSELRRSYFNKADDEFLTREISLVTSVADLQRTVADCLGVQLDKADAEAILALDRAPAAEKPALFRALRTRRRTLLSSVLPSFFPKALLG